MGQWLWLSWQFESSHQQILFINCNYGNCIEKTKINKKRGRKWSDFFIKTLIWFSIGENRKIFNTSCWRRSKWVETTTTITTTLTLAVGWSIFLSLRKREGGGFCVGRESVKETRWDAVAAAAVVGATAYVTHSNKRNRKGVEMGTSQAWLVRIGAKLKGAEEFWMKLTLVLVKFGEISVLFLCACEVNLSLKIWFIPWHLWGIFGLENLTYTYMYLWGKFGLENLTFTLVLVKFEVIATVIC